MFLWDDKENHLKKEKSEFLILLILLLSMIEQYGAPDTALSTTKQHKNLL